VAGAGFSVSSSKPLQSKGEALLVSRLQKESLKVHGDSLDAPKKAPAKK
jgi:hypothetical protein